MSLISGISKAPIPYDVDRATESVVAFGDISKQASMLISGMAGCSPYLQGLLTREGAWLRDHWHLSPEAIQLGIKQDVDAVKFDDLSVQLRRAKRRIALLIALADLGGIWTLEQVTDALTRFADFAVQKSLDLLIEAEVRRGKMPGLTVENLRDSAGLSVLAMGKMGAFELNYSSDIDLIMLFDETRHGVDHIAEVRAGFVRVTRRMCKLLSDVTSEGYVFRTDLRLRPDPSVTPVCLSMGAAERYYESLGRTWERAAFIKARACAGDIKAGEDFLKNLRPFVWRKHLDFAAIDDAHDMRLRIREHKGLGGEITLPGHNVKLGRGGIREIEFFTQTRQIIAGGRDVDLQVRGTLEGLRRLAEKGWVSEVCAQSLTETYKDHRTLEHRLQMIADAQTHDLPTNEPHFERLANFCGQSDVPVFKASLIASFEMVHNLTEAFFANEGGDEESENLFSASPEAQSIVDRWPNYPALRSTRASQIFRRLQPVMLARMTRASNAQEALIQFDKFLSGLPSGVQLFSMFEANPQLVDLLVDICATAPVLAQYLSKNPGVFEAVISGSFFEMIPETSELSAALTKELTQAADYEAQLLTARRWMKELHFRIGVLHLQGVINATQAAKHYSSLAEACLTSLYGPISDAFSIRHGSPPGIGAMILGMGSLGAQSLTATSDLDLIVIYDGDGQESSAGDRPLPVSTYYARFTQALVTALSSSMAEGRLFEVDMRLRPSGRKGPVATSLKGFKSYQSDKAWTWEHLALTRARPIAGVSSLSQNVSDFRNQLLQEKGDAATTKKDVQDMRVRLAEAASQSGGSALWQVKTGAGGMLDIELLAQAAALVAGSPLCDTQEQLNLCVTLNWGSTTEISLLSKTYGLLQIIHQVSRLITEATIDPAIIGQGAREFLLRETGYDNIPALEAELGKLQSDAAVIITDILRR